MPKYTVTVEYRLVERLRVQVEAPDQSEAQNIVEYDLERWDYGHETVAYVLRKEWQEYDRTMEVVTVEETPHVAD